MPTPIQWWRTSLHKLKFKVLLAPNLDRDTCRLRPATLIYATKNRSGRWKVPPTGHKKGGGIQGIRTASAAGAETLSDALGTRLYISSTNREMREILLTRLRRSLAQWVEHSVYNRGVASSCLTIGKPTLLYKRYKAIQNFTR